MKIGIITLPLHTNYGGILQAWALQTVLKRMGHVVTHIEENRKPIKLPLYKIIPVYVKRVFNFVRKGFRGRLRLEKYQNESYPVVGQYTHTFIKSRIDVTKVESFNDLHNSDFECLIVGSDQIWRPSYFKNIEHAFLDFAQKWKVKRIAYAPSLGTDNLCFTTDQIESCKKLIKKFDIVSVREKSSVQLIKDNFGVTPQWVLDPTLLLQKEDYLELIKDTPKSDGNLLVYLLDITKEKKDFVERIANERNLIPFYVSADPENFYLDIEARIQPPVEKWLKGFDDAQLVITDSFHACVFSIIFRKHFYVFDNPARGNSRFHSLSEIFDKEIIFVKDVKTQCQNIENYVSDFYKYELMLKQSLDAIDLQ